MKSIMDKIFVKGLSLGIVSIDSECRVTFINVWLRKHSDLKADDVLGRHIFDVFPEIRTRGKARYINDCIKQEQSAILSPMIHEYLLDLTIVKNGRKIQMIQEVRLFPLYEKHKTPGGLLIVIRDFTEQVLNEKAIIEKSNTLNAIRKINRMMVRTNSEAMLFSESARILTRDTDAPFVWFVRVPWNTEKPVIAKFAGSEADKFNPIVTRNNSPDIAMTLARKAIQTGETQISYRLENDRELKKWWNLFMSFQFQSVMAIPLIMGDRILGVIHIHRHEPRSVSPEIIERFHELADDIAFTLKNLEDAEKRKHLEAMVDERTSELRKARNELILKERLAVLGHFAGSISHELRNPLAVIDGAAYFLKMKLGNSDEKIDRSIELISANVKTSVAIIESLLNLFRMEKPRMEKNDLTVLITETLRSTRIPETVEVVSDTPDKTVFVNFETEQIRMALKNIIKNAIHAMSDVGKLMIMLRSGESGYIELIVSDTGPGIAADHLEKVFEPLFSTKTHGIGFGLSITKMIIENHGGTIRAESDPESGATFILTFPLS